MGPRAVCVHHGWGGAGVRVYPRKGVGRCGVVHRCKGVGGEGGLEELGRGKTSFDSKVLKGREGLGGPRLRVCP